MGLSDAKAKAVRCLQEGRVQAEERPDLRDKNLLKTGQVTPEQVIKILSATKGTEYRTEPHKDDSTVEVHFFEPAFGGENWHIKLYFLEPDCWFISVHRSHVRRTSRGNFQRRR